MYPVSWLIVQSSILDGEGETSPSKPDEPPIQDAREMCSNQGIYEAVM